MLHEGDRDRSQREAKAASWSKTALSQIVDIKGQGGQQKPHRAGDLAFVQSPLSLGGHELAG